MKKLLNSSLTNLPSLKEIREALNFLSLKESLAIFVLVTISLISLVAILAKLNNKYLVEVPTTGGMITEGVIGAPRFINPLLANSETDKDLTSLIYSGLLRVDDNGNLIPDLAKNYSVSEDGLSYTFEIKKGLFWHDGKPVTPDDVIFTIEKSKDPILKSPRRINWEGVTVEKKGETTIKFTLKQPYSSFLENTTMGILPKHIWKNIDSEVFSYSTFNLEPVGTGPYKISGLKRKSSGVPDYYDLVSFGGFALGKPKIDKIKIKFYSNESSLFYDLNNGMIEMVGLVSPEKTALIEKGGGRIETSVLPRIFAVFLNQNLSPVLADVRVRQALNLVLDKQKIIDTILGGYGATIDGPVPPNLTSADLRKNQEIFKPQNFKLAQDLLKKSGWSLNPKSGTWEKKNKKETTQLKFSLATADVVQLKETAEFIKKEWEKLGVLVDLKIFEVGDLNQNVIRPRKFEALFFGEVIGRYPDLFSFWHSSQRNDPGLNISMYTNRNADKILEQARTEIDNEKTNRLYEKFREELIKDVPAIFIYSPYFIYIVPEKIREFRLTPTSASSERFLNIYKWYIDTDYVWKFLIQP